MRTIKKHRPATIEEALQIAARIQKQRGGNHEGLWALIDRLEMERDKRDNRAARLEALLSENNSPADAGHDLG